nr:hypothetical protein BaRGS_032854 [Batillaria attramentaria]
MIKEYEDLREACRKGDYNIEFDFLEHQSKIALRSLAIISSLIDSAVEILSGIVMWWTSIAIRKRDPYLYPQVVKFILWVVCRRVKSPIVQALALDHRIDVCSNAVAIVCGYLGSRQFQNDFHTDDFKYVDPAGAILITVYIIYTWWRMGADQIKLLTGRTATPEFLSKVTWMVLDHDENIRHIETVRAFHSGNNFLVEVDIVLPETMHLGVAHDIGERLQQKLESLPEVERAFVHLDYDFTHTPKMEHKEV